MLKMLGNGVEGWKSLINYGAEEQQTLVVNMLKKKQALWCKSEEGLQAVLENGIGIVGLGKQDQYCYDNWWCVNIYRHSNALTMWGGRYGE